MKQKIGIDIQAAQGRKTGLGVYTHSLTEALSRVPQNGFEFCFYSKPLTLALSPKGRGEDNPLFPSPRLRGEGKSEGGMNTLQRMVWENVELPRLARNDHVDLLHVPAFAPPVFKSCRVVVTVHDLIGMIYPNQLGWPSRFYWGKWLPLAVKRAHALIADSENTKKDIQRILHVPEEKIRVIYPSGYEAFSLPRDAAKLQNLKSRLGIPEKYFLFVGTLEPRKNLKRVLGAFAQFLQTKTQDTRYQLVAAGSREFAHGKFYETLLGESFKRKDDVIFTDYLDQRDLVLLYGGAEALLYPSLYEGFGIPVLEAMASGIPVLTSRLSSLPEAAGEAAYYVDSYKTGDIARGMKEIAHNESLRKSLIAKGFEQIKKFSWEKTAQETLKVYESLM